MSIDQLMFFFLHKWALFPLFMNVHSLAKSLGAESHCARGRDEEIVSLSSPFQCYAHCIYMYIMHHADTIGFSRTCESAFAVTKTN